MFEEILQASNHQWLPPSRERVEILQHQKCQEPVRRPYALLAWSEKLCHLSPKLKHRIKVPHQTAAAHLHRLHLGVQTELGMSQMILRVPVNITATKLMSLILKGKELVTDWNLLVS